MPETHVLILRLLLAGVLGGLIGAEREYRAKVAGMRTHLLVAIGAALMLIVSRYGFDGQGDPSRVAAQIVSGIGFIGAGAIMVQRRSVHGLTTAAGIWVSTVPDRPRGSGWDLPQSTKKHCGEWCGRCALS